MSKIKQISVKEYAKIQTQPDPPELIDVRDRWEFNLAHVPTAQLKPLGQIYEWAKQLDKTKHYVLVCHHGGRSQMACEYLASLGVANVSNLVGGTHACAIEIDPTMAKY